jgi:uncharacterized membrane protein
MKEFLTDSLRRNPTIWLLFVVCLGLNVWVSVVYPPFSNPDEGTHYLRAFEVRKLRFINRPGKWGVRMPCADYILIGQRYGPLAYFNEDAIRRSSQPRCGAKTINSAGTYAPIGYVPSAIALRAGEIANWSVETRLRLARTLNGSLGCLVMLVGLLAIKSLRAPFALSFLLPINFWQRAALSADSLLLSANFLFMCWLARLAERGGRIQRLDWAVLLGSAATIGSTKGAYGLLCFSLLALWSRVPEGISARLFRLSLFAPGVLALALARYWSSVADPTYVYPIPGVDMAKQSAFIASDPLTFASILAENVIQQAPGMIVALSIQFSWLSSVPTVFIATLCGMMFLPLLVTSSNTFGFWPRMLMVVLIVIPWLGSYHQLYIVYSPVAAKVILGIQGRYFLPLVPLFIMAVSFRNRATLHMSDRLRDALSMWIPCALIAWLAFSSP